VVSQYAHQLAAERFYMETNTKQCQRCPPGNNAMLPYRVSEAGLADLMLIGEAPAAHEDRYEMPFIGVMNSGLFLALSKV
jgi:uracil-DNA glycosylase